MDLSDIANLDFVSVDAKKTITLKSNFTTGTSFSLTESVFTRSDDATITDYTAIGNSVDLSTDNKIVTVISENGENVKTYTIILQNTDARITAFDFGANKGMIDPKTDEITFATSYDYAIWKAELAASNVKYSDSAVLSFDPKEATNYTIEDKREITVTVEAGGNAKTYEIKLQIKVPNADIRNVVFGEIGRMGGANPFTKSLNHLDVSQVTDMTGMFSGAKEFNSDISQWTVDNVTVMSKMFDGASKFNQPLNDWKVDNITITMQMFYQAVKFNQPLNNWAVDRVTFMLSMFDGATNFNQDLSGWNTAEVIVCRDFSEGSGLQDDYKPKAGGCSF